MVQIGSSREEGLRDGSFEEATAIFNHPQGLAYNAKKNILYVANTENHALRYVAGSTWGTDPRLQYQHQGNQGCFSNYKYNLVQACSPIVTLQAHGSSLMFSMAITVKKMKCAFTNPFCLKYPSTMKFQTQPQQKLLLLMPLSRKFQQLFYSFQLQPPESNSI